MIISLADAQSVDMSIEQSQLDAFEQTVRALTNNNFQDKNVRFTAAIFTASNVIEVSEATTGLRIGDTVEVNYSPYNDGLYVVNALSGTTITVIGRPFIVDSTSGAMVTLVKYPADVKQGVKKLIEYDVKMSSKTGIKSESIGRMSTTYFDVNATENIDGYPSALLSFLGKYEKMRW